MLSPDVTCNVDDDPTDMHRTTLTDHGHAQHLTVVSATPTATCRWILRRSSLTLLTSTDTDTLPSTLNHPALR